jgi:DNA-binding GntR family transcriptional regulator
MVIHQQRLSPVSIVDQVTNSVRRSILRGEFKPGSSFSITQLVKTLGVSAIPVREALQRLEAQGLILRRYARTAVVAPISTEELRDIYDLRILVECETVGKAAPLLDDASMSELSLHMKAMQGLALNDEAFWAHHSDFHHVLLAPALTPLRERVVRQLWHAAERYVRLVYDEAGAAARPDTHDLHNRLFQAARTRSARELKRELAQHYQENMKHMLVALASFNAQSTGEKKIPADLNATAVRAR